MAEYIDPQEMMFTKFEPKLQHRFVMEIEGIPVYMIKKVDMPSMSAPEVEISHINTTNYVRGKSKWSSETALELYDPISPSGTQIVMDWERMHHETVTGRSGYHNMYAKDVTIQVLGPIGDIISSWTYKSAWIKAIDFGSMDYGTEADMNMINLTLQYDIPILHF